MEPERPQELPEKPWKAQRGSGAAGSSSRPVAGFNTVQPRLGSRPPLRSGPAQVAEQPALRALEQPSKAQQGLQPLPNSNETRSTATYAFMHIHTAPRRALPTDGTVEATGRGRGGGAWGGVERQGVAGGNVVQRQLRLMGVIQQSAINRSQVFVEFIKKRWIVLDVPRYRAKHQLMVKLIP